MSRILVEIDVPAAGLAQDFSIPYEVKMHHVVRLVAEILKDTGSSDFAPGEAPVLCDAETGAIFNVNLTPEELGLETGSRLIMF